MNTYVLTIIGFVLQFFVLYTSNHLLSYGLSSDVEII